MMGQLSYWLFVIKPRILAPVNFLLVGPGGRITALEQYAVNGYCRRDAIQRPDFSRNNVFPYFDNVVFSEEKMKSFGLSFFMVLVVFQAGAQGLEPGVAIINTNNIRASVYSNGRLFWTGSGGHFEMLEEGVSPILLGGLWLGAVDGAGNLRISCQLYDDGKVESQFQPGTIKTLYPRPEIDTNLNRIWRVSRKEIIAHQVDFGADGRIDSIIPAIYSWPGRGNPHSLKYNGFEIFDGYEILAPFEDWDGDGAYNPDKGDYPRLAVRGHRFTQPDEMAWWAFNDLMERENPWLYDPLLVEVHCQAFVFNCRKEEEEVMNNSLFLHYTLINKSLEPLDSIRVGMFLDFAIGCPDDDYIGVLPENGTVYAYNSGHEDGPCGHPPANLLVSSTLFDDLYVTDAPRNTPPDTVFTSAFDRIMPLQLQEETGLPNNAFPVAGLEYYRYLTGSWRDGNPLTYGGSGYNTGGMPIAFPFTGFPTAEGDWNEKNAGRTPGRRRALASAGHFRLNPEGVNSFTIGITAQNCWGCHPEGSAESFSRAFHEIREIDLWMRRDWLVDFPCTQSKIEIERPPPFSPMLTLFPNPAKNRLTVHVENAPAYWYRVYNAHGQLMLKRDNPEPVSFLETTNWLKGVYFLQVRAGGETISQSFVIE
ncbi:MAG: T9SS type A sorting domain-containing protein [Phaeodactylibacter sp.]|nr:T9SS type A sorting domain-containing protein [Phaeodactylibacter sp.]